MSRSSCTNRWLQTSVVAGLLLAAVMLLATEPFVRAGTAASPGNSHAFGKALGDWETTWASWLLGSTDIAPDANGNADVGNVVLMALPNAPGDGTPASLDVTLNSGQAFVLPFFFWLGNSYEDGSVDPMANLDDFRRMDITVKVDGVAVITPKNVMDYYTETAFDPPLTTDLPPGIGATAWVFAQDIGMVHPPLTPGKHTITVDESISLPDLGFDSAYHNTWNITVRPGK